MSEQTHLIEYLDSIDPKLYYITWDVDKGNGDRRKSFSEKGYESPKEALDMAMKYELNNSSGFKTVRPGIETLDWYKRETISDPPMKQNITIEIEPSIGETLSFLDDGDLKVKGLGKYKNYPWVLLTSLENNYDIIMSLKAINHRLRKGSKHRSQNYTILSLGNSRSKPAYWFTVGYLLKSKVKLNVRTTPNTDTIIADKYEKVTGESITDYYYDNGYIMYNPNTKTFTDNADLFITLNPESVRQYLYFPENKIGKREGVVKNNIEHIQNTNYVWTLFNYGFRLGTSHNKNEIFEYVEVKEREFLEDFRKGYKYGEVEN